MIHASNNPKNVSKECNAQVGDTIIDPSTLTVDYDLCGDRPAEVCQRCWCNGHTAMHMTERMVQAIGLDDFTFKGYRDELAKIVKDGR